MHLYLEQHSNVEHKSLPVYSHDQHTGSNHTLRTLLTSPVVSSLSAVNQETEKQESPHVDDSILLKVRKSQWIQSTI